MDIRLFRNSPDLVRESQRRRFKPVEAVDEVIALDEAWRKKVFELNTLNKEANENQKAVGQKKKNKEDATDLIEKGTKLKTIVAEKEKECEAARVARDTKLYAIGNLVHDSVPVSNDEKNNFEVKTWGTNRETTPDLKHHHQLLAMIDGYEPEVGSTVAGHRGYYLKNWGLYLNQALINYGLQFLHKKKYSHVQTPFFMKKSMMSKVAALAEFDEALFKVTGNPEDEEMYLIATSEQPCCCLHYKQNVRAQDLPIKYCGYSTCFRKEAGSHGKDAWGIFRIHQFEKIEQFVLCAPDASWEMQEEMLKASEEFYQSLELPYHVVTIVSGELNNAAAKKYDLEAWFPTLGNYRELVSCSNCTDYQSRRLEIKYGTARDEEGQTPFVHMLNSTLCATERTICCILENYQTEKGIRIPNVLKPFLAAYIEGLEDPELIPFVKEAPAMGKK